jgi:lipid-A-disaccharide synthase
VVPELLQETPRRKKLARAVLEWLAAPARISAVQQRFQALHHELRRDTAP